MKAYQYIALKGKTERGWKDITEEYKRRSIVETVHSVIKRKRGSFVRSRIPEVAEKEIALKIIAYNIRRTIILNNSILFLLFLGFLESFF